MNDKVPRAFPREGRPETAAKLRTFSQVANFMRLISLENGAFSALAAFEGLPRPKVQGGQPTCAPGTTGRSGVMTLSDSSKLTAERIMPWLSMPDMVRGARLAT